MSIWVVYFWYGFAVNLFRTLMYIFQHEHVTRVKVSKQAWEQPPVREVMYAYTSMIRTFMAFRAAICFWAALYLEQGPVLTNLVCVMLSFDMFMMTKLLLKDNSKTMQHQNILVPGTIQASLCLSGIVALCLH